MTQSRWTKQQLKLAFNLYCQLPFGKLHKGNYEIIELADLIGRTPSALAMKLCNIASIDPVIITSGRKGLGNASMLDREVWDEFHANWDQLTTECLHIHEQFRAEKGLPGDVTQADDDLENFTGETRQVMIEQRIRQQFFRRAVLSSYHGQCCMSGLSEPRLLIASHVVPWSKDQKNRLNPRNGLCLSVLHDKAFDRGLISLDDDFRVILSKDLRQRNDKFMHKVFFPLAGQQITLPERFAPDKVFLGRHRKEVFLGNG